MRCINVCYAGCSVRFYGETERSFNRGKANWKCKFALSNHFSILSSKLLYLHNEAELSGNSISISGLEIRRFSSSAQVLHTTEKHVISRR